jgi:hypothetical protein
VSEEPLLTGIPEGIVGAGLRESFPAVERLSGIVLVLLQGGVGPFREDIEFPVVRIVEAEIVS